VCVCVCVYVCVYVYVIEEREGFPMMVGRETSDDVMKS